jgi:hypothetical protein
VHALKKPRASVRTQMTIHGRQCSHRSAEQPPNHDRRPSNQRRPASTTKFPLQRDVPASYMGQGTMLHFHEVGSLADFVLVCSLSCLDRMHYGTKPGAVLYFL